MGLATLRDYSYGDKMIFTYNQATKSVNINNLPEEAWDVISGQASGEELDSYHLYKTVPFLYRCVDMRAKTISTFPRDIMRGDDVLNEEDGPLFSNVDTLLYQVETALCIFAQAYLMKRPGMIDLDSIRWLAPQSIKPVYSPNQGLTGFKRTMKKSETPDRLDVDEVVYFWTPSIISEVGPGVAPVETVKTSAGVLGSIGGFAKSYFDRGAIFPMLLRYDGPVRTDEAEKLERWWKRLFTGVKDAWETVAVNANIKPEILSSPLNEMAMTELTEMHRENVATGLGVPHSMVLSNAANFATSNQDVLNFYDQTIVPEFDLIAETLNEQLFDAMELRVVPRPERLEIYQQRNLQVASGIKDLIDTGVLDIDEGREIAGYEPRDEQPQIEEPIIAQLPQPQNEAMRRLHLEQWERKSLNCLKAGKSALCAFESDYIDNQTREAVELVLSTATTPDMVKSVFSLNQQPAIVPVGLENDAQSIEAVISGVLKDMNSGS